MCVYRIVIVYRKLFEGAVKSGGLRNTKYNDNHHLQVLSWLAISVLKHEASLMIIVNQSMLMMMMMMMFSVKKREGLGRRDHVLF
jgi:hypothetical protein